jgi:hypothetical protein
VIVESSSSITEATITTAKPVHGERARDREAAREGVRAVVDMDGSLSGIEVNLSPGSR